jgi:hypothetical protein
MSHDIHITARVSDENPDEARYTISFPQEWGDAVLNALAARVSPDPRLTELLTIAGLCP